jgi:hypothetical protein
MDKLSTRDRIHKKMVAIAEVEARKQARAEARALAQQRRAQRAAYQKARRARLKATQQDAARKAERLWLKAERKAFAARFAAAQHDATHPDARRPPTPPSPAPDDAPRKVVRNRYLARRDGETAMAWRQRTWAHKRHANSDTKGLPDELQMKHLNASDLLWPTHCPVLGVELDYTGQDVNYGWSIDRLIPELGYVPGNVKIISRLANRIKTDATAAEVEKVLLWMRQQGL